MNSAVNSHFIAICKGRVATPAQNTEFTNPRLVKSIDGPPLAAFKIVLPHIIQSISLFIFASEYCEFIAVTYYGGASSARGSGVAQNL